MIMSKEGRDDANTQLLNKWSKNICQYGKMNPSDRAPGPPAISENSLQVY